MTRTGAAAIGLLALAVALGVLALPAAAFGYNENFYAPGGGCGGDCHTTVTINEANCASCHTFGPDNTNFSGTGGDSGSLPDFPLIGEFAQKGPHGIYKTTTDRCSMCHTLHDAPAGFRLLPGNTVKATCLTCHDGSGGFGVYGAIQARTGSPSAGGHSIEATKVVPGGDAATGGSSSATTFRGPSGTLTCSDCHSPHDANTVQAFTGERVRIRAHEGAVYSSKLLKQRPTGASTSTAVYGSDWCAGCHRGRNSDGVTHNHPVETKAARPADFYYYNYLAVYRTSGFPTDGQYESGATTLTNANATIGAIGNVMVAGNGTHPINTSPNWYEANYHSSPWLMTYPRSAVHSGHAPICQQCHEDKRDCGTLSADGAAANVVRDGLWGVDADGLQNHAPFLPNPRFQNFPHETEDPTLLVESGDNLCMNCHPPTVLP